ncbi:recombinase family protein [Streptomyces sp. NRRL B-24572]|uniref:recombinase family protein n=1 Tax=Streptomyces sp. NRRL B-24572 TaxID=1962156 RepID=UPI0015C5083F|nr:recombinase family protein [Streptomyces sp. NRRL B-24572]
MPIVARPRSRAAATITVARYRRVSTKDQLDGYGLEVQDALCNSWLTRNPEATVFGDYVDEAVSGALESRPGMDRLIADADRGSFNRILIPSVDRVGRTARAAYNWAWRMGDIGIHFISVREGIDTGADGGWQAFAQCVQFAEMEWRRIKERTAAGKEFKISYGGWPGGPAPYGYRIAVDENSGIGCKKRMSVLVSDDREAMILSLAISFIVDDGMNFTEAAEELDRRDLLTRSGAPWTAANLRNRLHHESLHGGYVLYRKTHRGKGGNTTPRRDGGTPAHDDQVKIGVPRIVTAGRAEALAAAMSEIGFQNGREKDRVYPLTGRIQGHCGLVFTGSSQGSEARRGYRCQGLTPRRDGETGQKGRSCAEPYFNAEEIEKAVWGELGTLIKDETRLHAAVNEWVFGLSGDEARYAARVQDLECEIGERELVIRTEVPKYIQAGMDPAVAAAATKGLQDELRETEEQHRIAKEWLDDHKDLERRAGNLAAIVTSAEGRLDGVTPEERREVFDMLDIRVTFGDVTHLQKPGLKCQVTAWHWDNDVLVPPDPTDEEWRAVVAAVKPFFAAKHFTSKYDIHEQFKGMLHRLRQGLAWAEMPTTWGPVNAMRERQLAWWKRGAWPVAMEMLDAGERGVPAYKRPTLPQLFVTCRLGNGLLARERGLEPRGVQMRDREVMDPTDPRFAGLAHTLRVLTQSCAEHPDHREERRP